MNPDSNHNRTQVFTMYQTEKAERPVGLLGELTVYEDHYVLTCWDHWDLGFDGIDIMFTLNMER